MMRSLFLVGWSATLASAAITQLYLWKIGLNVTTTVGWPQNSVKVSREWSDGPRTLCWKVVNDRMARELYAGK